MRVAGPPRGGTPMYARSLSTLLVVAALLAPAVAASRVVRIACREGIAPPLPRCVVECSRPVRCDADEQCNGIFTFAIRVCGEVACSDHLVSVAVGQREDIRLSTALGNTPQTFVLRCRSHPPTIPCPVQSTSTTSTLPEKTCLTDADCDDGNGCTHDDVRVFLRRGRPVWRQSLCSAAGLCCGSCLPTRQPGRYGRVRDHDDHHDAVHSVLSVRMFDDIRLLPALRPRHHPSLCRVSPGPVYGRALRWRHRSAPL